MRALAVALVLTILIGVSCQPAQPPAGTPPAGQARVAASRPAPTTLPAEARIPLSELTPAPKPPANAPEADRLPERADEIVQQAEALLSQRDYTKAISLLDRAKGFAPNSSRILRDLGLAYAELGDRAKAEAALRDSVKDAPDHVRVQLLLGMYAAMGQQSGQAILRYRTALLCRDATDDSPDTGEALLRLGILLEQEGSLTAAAECYARLGELVSRHDRTYATNPRLRELVMQPERILVSRGKLLLRLGRAAEAAEPLETAYRRDKAHPEAGRLAVEALLEIGNFDRARAVVLEMIQGSCPGSIESAEAYVRVRNDPRAVTELLDALQARGTRPDASLVIALAEVTVELGATEQAAAILTKHLAGMPQHEEVLVRLARLYARTGDALGAMKQLAVLLTGEAPATGRIAAEVRDIVPGGARKSLADDLAVAADKAADKDKPALLTLAGMLAWAADERAKAVALLNRAISADAQFWPACEMLVDVYTAGGDFDAVDKLAEQVNRVGGDSYFWFYVVGKSQFSRGDVIGTISNLEQARARNGRHVPTLVLLGQAYAQAGRGADAERALLSAFALAADDLEVNRLLFELYARTNKTTEAGQVVARLLRDSPRSVPGRVLLGRYYLLTNQHDRGRTLLEELLAEAPDDVAVRLLELRFDLPDGLGDEPVPGDRAKAIAEKIERILKLDESNIEARARYADLLVNQHRFDEAAATLEFLYRRTPHDLRAVAAYLDALVKADQADRAAAVVGDLLGRKEIGPATRAMALQTLVRVKRYARAEQVLEKWLAELGERGLQRGELDMLRQQALGVYEAAEHFDKAQKLLDEWIAAGPDEEVLPALRAQKLRLYAKAGQFDQAQSYADKWIRNEPGNNRPRMLLLAVLVDAKQYQRAQDVIDKWIAGAGANQGDLVNDLRAAKADLFAEQEKFEELQGFGEGWVAQDEASDDPFLAMVRTLLRHKKYEAALTWAEDWFARREKLPPGEERDRRLLSISRIIVDALLLAGKNDQALKRAEAVLKEHPKDADALRMLAAAYRALDREDDVLKTLQQILEIDPDDPGVNNDLGYTWADRGINLDKAEKMIRKALAAQPRSVAIQDSFGWVLYKQGRFPEAKTVFDQALKAELDLLHAIILDHAGDVCWRLDLKDQAVRLWERAVDMATKDERTDSDDKKVLAETPGKIQAARKDKPPKVAPLGAEAAPE